MKKWKILYPAAFTLICIFPFAGMFFTSPAGEMGNQRLSELPQLHNEDGAFNKDYLSGLGNYFQDHFAGREELVTANALVHGKIFQVSSVDSVVQGKNGWLYYSDSLNDYKGTELLPERSLYNIARSLKLLQNDLEDRAVQFVFTTAPNKNTLYADNMPYYQAYKVSEDTNLKRLAPLLAEEGVQYVDLYSAFSGMDEVLYHERDSHWNNRGAMLASRMIFDTLGKGSLTAYEEETAEIRRDFSGDLDQMLYPLALTDEDEIYYSTPQQYTYVEEVESNFFPRISTVNPEKEGSLVMYRDSFCNALLPFMAEEYEKAYFSRGVPYQISDVDTHEADTVVIERAERFLPDMAQNPPAAAARSLSMELMNIMTETESAELTVMQQGFFQKISGYLSEEQAREHSCIYVSVNGTELYEAYPMDAVDENGRHPYGYCLYLPMENGEISEEQISVYVSDHESNSGDYLKDENVLDTEFQSDIVNILTINAPAG